MARRYRTVSGKGKTGPGSRGGHPWKDEHGNVRYGPKPKGATIVASSVQGKTISRKSSTAAVRTAAAKQIAARKAQASGQRAVRTGVGGGSGKARYGELRPGYRIKAQTPAQKRQAKTRMLAELDKTFKSGKDPHGNALDAKTLQQVNFLATSLRTELHGFR